MKKTKLLVCSTALLAALAALSSCALMPAAGERKASPLLRSYEMEEYETAAAYRGDVVLQQRVTCRYSPASEAKLSFSVSGVEVASILVSEGDEVKKGDVLIVLEHSELDDELKRREGELERLLLEMELLEKNVPLELELLRDSGAGDDRVAARKSELNTQMDVLSIRIESLKGSVAELEAGISARQLVATMDGFVTYIRDMSNGARSQLQETMITIADKSSSVFTVTGEDAALFSPGDRVEISTSGELLPATVAEPSEFGGDGSEAYLVLDDFQAELKDNASGVVYIELDRSDDAVCIPGEALRTRSGETIVYVPDQSGYKTVRVVETGLAAGGAVEIISGLSEGELVILE